MGYSLEAFMTQKQISDFCKKYHVKRLAIFGSAIHNRLRPESDLDILVEFDESHIPGFFTVGHMENELSGIVGRKVDLRTPEDLSHYFRDEVVKEAEVQYEER